MTRCVIAMWLLLLVIAACFPAQAETIKIPFVHYPSNLRYEAKDGWTDNFQNGAPEEQRLVQRDGFLWATVNKPSGTGPFPFVVLMHGCGGLTAATRQEVDVWADWFRDHGTGTIVVDSFTTRSIKEVCGSPAHYWARRRTDDAYSALAYLAQQPYVLANQVFIFGQSNGARTVLYTMQNARASEHGNQFAGAFAMYPNCKVSIPWNFYAPLFVFIGGKDDADDPQFCRDMGKTKRAANHPRLEITEYPEATHDFDVSMKARVSHGWHLKYDADATSDVRKRLADYFESIGIKASR